MEESNPLYVNNMLVLLHKIITRSLGMITKFSQGSGPDDLLQDGFRMLVNAFVPVTETLILGEEDLVFPLLRGRITDGQTSQLVEEHRQIHAILLELTSWQGTGTSSWEVGRMAELHGNVRALYTLWRTHTGFEEGEIARLNPENGISADESASLAGRLAAHLVEHSLPHEITLAFMVYNLFPADREVFTRLIPEQLLSRVRNAWQHEWTPMIPYLLD